jgi:large subunit ribosomal protein L13
MKTYSAKPSEITRKWYVLDASELPLGRLSTRIADLLIGKNKPSYTPHIDGGDYAIVINSDQLVVTGKKLEDKKYYRHSGYPGGLKESNLQFELDKESTEVIRKAVRGMLPVNKLRDGRLARLKVYKDAEHNHTAQKPETLKLSKKGGK